MRKLDYVFVALFLFLGAFSLNSLSTHQVLPVQVDSPEKIAGRSVDQDMELREKLADLQATVAALRDELNQLGKTNPGQNAAVVTSSGEDSLSVSGSDQSVPYSQASDSIMVKDQQLLAETNDPALSSWLQDTVLANLDNSINRQAISNVETQCGSTLCKARFEFDRENKSNAMDSIMEAMSTDNMEIIYSGDDAVVLYVYKEEPTGG